MKKRGTILTENIIFIVLNIAFLVILSLFLFSKTNDIGVTEEKYAKQIALLIDAARPVMVISLEMDDAIKKAEEENYPVDQIVIINQNENIVTVKLSADSQGYQYSFFNEVAANANFNTTSRNGYYININEK